MKRAALILAASALSLAWADASRAAASHWNGGRTVPVHRLAPLDADGDKVSPTDRLPRPLSQVRTCGQCHDVAAMKGGSHFRTGLVPEEVEDAVRAEPWFLADEKTGTAIPLSLRGQKGAFAPREAGLSCWQWTKTFGRAFPGGGIGSDTNAMAEVAGARQRWFVTGALEANCLACHQQGGYDSSEWARQVLRENWQGAATAASGLGLVEGMNERLDDSWDAATRPENPDDHLFRVPEKTVYDMHQFDAKNRCVFKVGKPRSENCLNCHAASQKDMPSHAIAGDVHLQRGMKCVDCHQNGMDHKVATKSCTSCHTGEKGAGPRPVHAGIPLVHFEKLSCAVCHSGVTAGGELAQVRTARANRIGIYGRAQWATDVPHIVEPVFVKNAKGVVEPCRMMWPSGFYRAAADGSLKPVVPEEAAKLAGDAFTVVDRVDAALRILKETDGPVGAVELRADGAPVYRTPTNEVPLIAAADRVKGEFENLLASLFNAKVGVTKERVAAVRDGKVYTMTLKVTNEKEGTVGNVVEECPGVKVPADEPFPVGTLSADGKTFVPMVDKWTLGEYARVKDAERPFTQEMVRRALANAGGDVRYVASGLVFSLGADGALVKTAGAPEAQPLSWPISHDVRPARQARGAAPVKCADCHTADSKVFLGTISPAGPVQDAGAEPLSQAELLGVCGCYHTVLGTTFGMRPVLKTFLWTVFALVCLFLVAAAAVALNKFGKWIAANSTEFVWGLFKWIVDMGFVVCLLYLLASGVIGWLCGGMTSWWIVLHMVAGGGFATCVVLMLAFRSAARAEKLWTALAWALWTFLAAATVFTAVMPMMTVFGSEGQEVLLWCHRCASVALAAVSALVCRLCCGDRFFGKKK